MTIDISKFWLGMDRDFLPTYTESSYPRYNIIESGGNYRIEIALPGWKKNELEVIIDGEELQLKGKKEQKLVGDERFVHQGLSLKSFERRFILNGDLQVDTVNLQDGLLTIALSRTPNSKRKTLEIE
jgi:HSP20 family molecular chaperone IbpA